MQIKSLGALLLASLVLQPGMAAGAAPVSESAAMTLGAADKKDPEKDRAIQAKDKLTVSISDLEKPNEDTVVKVVADEKGEITLPHLKNPVKAKGLTCQKLEGVIVKAYRDANILYKANVKVAFRKDPKP
jgi:Polysaccharide biosynthesis/export protein